MKFYRINVSGEKFFLSDKNLLSDAPNVFTRRFANDIARSSRDVSRKHVHDNRMAVDRNPEVFRYIHRYLQGYDISNADISSINKQHIIEDAKFYGLKGLQKILEDKWKELEYIPLVDYSSDSDDMEVDQNMSHLMNLDIDTISWDSMMDLDLEFASL